MSVSATSRAPRPIPALRVLLPHEHGAWAQLLVPLVTALCAGRFGASGLVLAGGALAAFLSHEPLLTLLGHRGARPREAHRGLAIAALITCGVIAASALVASAVALGRDADLLLVPLALCVPVLALALRKNEHNLAGELLASAALATWSIPAAHLVGLARSTSIAIGLAWVVAFALSTFGVTGVIANLKRPQVARAVRATGALGALGALAFSWLLAVAGPVPTAFALALVPMELFAMALCVFPPHPRQLYRVGFSNLAASLAMAVLLVIGLKF